MYEMLPLYQVRRRYPYCQCADATSHTLAGLSSNYVTLLYLIRVFLESRALFYQLRATAPPPPGPPGPPPPSSLKVLMHSTDLDERLMHTR